jgi:undecaprenyl-diphosphatase
MVRLRGGTAYMDWIQAVVLASLQGITEFLPISSSAHLILLPSLVGWPDQGLAFDVAVHVGTLAAVVSYFWHELVQMTRDWLGSLRLGQRVGDSRLVWGVLFGTIPVAVAGWLLNFYGPNVLRSPLVVAVATVAFALLLWWADWQGRQRRDEHSLGWRDVIIIGLAQALALIPGTSRSGITITAAMALGLTWAGAARFSFLLAIPVIGLAGGLKGVEAWTTRATVDWSALVMGTLIAGVCAYLCIHYFLQLLQRIGLFPFVLYRLVSVNRALRKYAKEHQMPLT